MSREDIARRLAAGWRSGMAALTDPRLDGVVPPGREALVAGDPMPAAVLVPIVERKGGHTILLTQRTAHLAHHPGQVSFPGGRLEGADCGDAVQCALRETEEEIGLGRDRVTVLGRLADYVTGTGFIVTPVVGAVTPPVSLTLDAFEVAEAFELPLAFVLDPANHTLMTREVGGRTRAFWAMTWQDRTIWGATAGMLVNLSRVLAEP